MSTSTLRAFRYAGIAALPLCVALALVTGVRSGSELILTPIECVDEAPATLDEVPFLGELTVTATRLEVAPPEVRSASDRSRPPRPQVKPSRARYPSVL